MTKGYPRLQRKILRPAEAGGQSVLHAYCPRWRGAGRDPRDFHSADGEAWPMHSIREHADECRGRLTAPRPNDIRFADGYYYGQEFMGAAMLARKTWFAFHLCGREKNHSGNKVSGNAQLQETTSKASKYQE